MSPELTELLGSWWDGSLPWSVKPHDPADASEYLPSLVGGFLPVGAPCTLIDCRIPEDVRREIALNLRPMMSYKKYIESKALTESAFQMYIGRRSAAE